MIDSARPARRAIRKGATGWSWSCLTRRTYGGRRAWSPNATLYPSGPLELATARFGAPMPGLMAHLKDAASVKGDLAYNILSAREGAPPSAISGRRALTLCFRLCLSGWEVRAFSPAYRGAARCSEAPGQVSPATAGASLCQTLRAATVSERRIPAIQWAILRDLLSQLQAFRSMNLPQRLTRRWLTTTTKLQRVWSQTASGTRQRQGKMADLAGVISQHRAGHALSPYWSSATRQLACLPCGSN